MKGITNVNYQIPFLPKNGYKNMDGPLPLKSSEIKHVAITGAIHKRC